MLRRHLRGDGNSEDDREDRGADEIAEIHRHRDGIAAGFTERRGENLDDPEAERDGGDFSRALVRGGVVQQ